MRGVGKNLWNWFLRKSASVSGGSCENGRSLAILEFEGGD